MIVITCIDDGMGMLFNSRRQSQDSVLRRRILEITAGKRLWMNHYSEKQFQKVNAPQINVEEDFLLEADIGDYCFVETQGIQPYEKWIEKLIVYHWNRSYPSDLKFDIDLCNWKLVKSKDFKGSSHETITEEVYTR